MPSRLVSRLLFQIKDSRIIRILDPWSKDLNLTHICSELIFNQLLVLISKMHLSCRQTSPTHFSRNTRPKKIKQVDPLVGFLLAGNLELRLKNIECLTNRTIRRSG